MISVDIAERLSQRREELEDAALARIQDVADLGAVDDPEYLEGLHAAVSAALGYGIAGVTGGPDRAPPVPPELPAQARLAARNGVPLDTVLRRYFAGHALLADFVFEVSREHGGALGQDEMQRAMRWQATLLDRLLVVISNGYVEGIEGVARGGEQARLRQVKRLLAGELLDARDLACELDGWHLGLVVSGLGARAVLRELATRAGLRLLQVSTGGATVWAWLSSRAPISAGEVVARAEKLHPDHLSLGVGEPGRGVGGWRLTHSQAKAAWQVATRGRCGPLRYAEVALLSTALRDETLRRSLSDLFLAPINEETDGGHVMRKTLRAYFSCNRNVSSAAAALGVDRKTISRRLQTAEQRLGCTLDSCAAEMESALRLDEMGLLTGAG